MPAEPTIVSLGCRLNSVESATMRKLAVQEGADDTVIINTCAVTNEAVRTARQRIRKAKRDQPDARLVVTGCAAQIAPDDFADMHEVDIVIGNHEKLDPSTWRTIANGDDNAPMVNDIMAVRESAPHLIDGYGERARAYLQIQNGCDHRCTFCIIPYGRGNSRSTPIAQIVEAARKLTDAGHREIVLTGVDITSYGGDLDEPVALGQLVSTLLDKVPHLYRLRLSSIDGAEIDEELFERLVSDERVAPHLHLSLQAGDNLILKRMKRRHTREQSIKLCHDIIARRRDVAFGADIIAGFPTETEEMFQRSIDLIDEARLSYVHVFPYSARAGTPAARMPQLAGDIVRARAGRLRAAATKAQHAFLESLEGRRETAIIEAGGRARLGNFVSVQLTDECGLPGDVALLDIGARTGDMVFGAPVLDAHSKPITR